MLRRAFDTVAGCAAIAAAPFLALLWAAAIYVRLFRAVAAEIRRPRPGTAS